MKSKNNEERRQRLIALREAMQLDPSGMAVLCGIEDSMYRRIEYGERDISVIVLEKIADAIGLKAFRLLEYLDRYCGVKDIWGEMEMNTPKKTSIIDQHESVIHEEIRRQEAKDNLLLDTIDSEYPFFKAMFLGNNSECNWRNLEVVTKPEGFEQHPGHWIDQTKSGEDSFSGHTYTRIEGGKWLKAYFEMR